MCSSGEKEMTECILSRTTRPGTFRPAVVSRRLNLSAGAPARVSIVTLMELEGDMSKAPGEGSTSSTGGLPPDRTGRACETAGIRRHRWTVHNSTIFGSIPIAPPAPVPAVSVLTHSIFINIPEISPSACCIGQKYQGLEEKVSSKNALVLI